MKDVQSYFERVRLLPRYGTDDDECSEAARKDSAESRQNLSVIIVLVALSFMYSVHNLIAPNMTAVAKLFHFNNFERDAYIGGELTLFFYFPGVLGALLAGVLSGMFERRLLFAVLALLTSISCLMTTRVQTFTELVWARAITGFGIGGSLPVVYSLVGDWFPARRRTSATAFVTAASGAGVFAGQCIATLTGTVDWRWPFFLIALPSAATSAAIWWLAEEPVRGCQEEGVKTLTVYQNAGFRYMPTLSARHLRALQNRTNLVVILQAFPGNIPWGVIIVYLHDFLVQDLGLSRHSALGAITTLAGSAFGGILVGGFIGESLYSGNKRHLAIFGGICNIVRAIPFFILFGWKDLFGPLERSSEGSFFLLLMFGGFVATMASPCTGAMLLNVNLPETRGSVMAMYSVLDDLSKGFGTLFVSVIVRMVGCRSVAYQISLLLWVFTGVALCYTYYTYDEDEEQMSKYLDEAAMESMVLLSKQRAQNAIRDRSKAAGEAHFAQKNLGARREQLTPSNLQWPSGRRNPHESQSAFVGTTNPVAEANSCAGPSSVGTPNMNLGHGPSSYASNEVSSRAAASGRKCGAHTLGRSQADKERLHRAVRAAGDAASKPRQTSMA